VVSEIEKGDAMIRFFLKLEPDSMCDFTWARRINECFFGLETIGKILLGEKK
jgi:hypothetical protein